MNFHRESTWLDLLGDGSGMRAMSIEVEEFWEEAQVYLVRVNGPLYAGAVGLVAGIATDISRHDQVQQAWESWETQRSEGASGGDVLEEIGDPLDALMEELDKTSSCQYRLQTKQ